MRAPSLAIETQPFRRLVASVIAATLMAACSAQPAPDAEATEAAPTLAAPSTPAPASPDLAACPAREPVEEGLRERTKPIAVPAAFGQVMRSDMDNFAFTTTGGATICVDVSWLESIRDPALSPDKRFASFDWDGYEAYGHVIVDRSGKGQVVDTGVPPVASPSGKLLAAADLGEAGFGALNAFAVWRIEPTGLRQLATHEDMSATDWRIESWAGEACIDLSAIPWDGYTGDPNTPRARFHAREGEGWRLEPGGCTR